jgi:hypothetical protein
MQAHLPDFAFYYETDVRSIVTRLFKSGELDRRGERWRKGTLLRYRYFRRRLEGAITDLDRVFRETAKS